MRSFSPIGMVAVMVVLASAGSEPCWGRKTHQGSSLAVREDKLHEKTDWGNKMKGWLRFGQDLLYASVALRYLSSWSNGMYDASVLGQECKVDMLMGLMEDCVKKNLGRGGHITHQDYENVQKCNVDMLMEDCLKKNMPGDISLWRNCSAHLIGWGALLLTICNIFNISLIRHGERVMNSSTSCKICKAPSEKDISLTFSEKFLSRYSGFAWGLLGTIGAHAIMNTYMPSYTKPFEIIEMLAVASSLYDVYNSFYIKFYGLKLGGLSENQLRDACENDTMLYSKKFSPINTQIIGSFLGDVRWTLMQNPQTDPLSSGSQKSAHRQKNEHVQVGEKIL